jgi:murein DD-endopeptidase MepM/ murein hydrolase activator NlpD
MLTSCRKKDLSSRFLLTFRRPHANYHLVMRNLGSPNRLLAHQRTRRRKIRLWPALIVGLLGLNLYLFGIRGFPTNTQKQGPSPEKTSAAAKKPASIDSLAIQARIGQMRGVAGVRANEASPATPTHVAMVSDDPLGFDSIIRNSGYWPGQRFDLERAASPAGQRSLEQWCHSIDGSVQRGDNFSTALNRANVSGPEVFGLIEALKPVFDFRHCRAGDRFELLSGPNGKTYRFAYHASPLVSYRVDRLNGRLQGKRVEHETQMELAEIAVRIEGSLWQSLAQAGERGSLVMMIVDIFAWDIDFYVDTHPGDTIRLLVEKHRIGDKFARYGRIMAAEYDGVVGRHRAYWYDAAFGDASRNATRGYFDEHGDSLRKAFLKSPLKFARVSSRYGLRVHPVLGFNKMHNGVDFSAPIGTPVWAPADGSVLAAGRQGACGIGLKLRHANGYRTVYCHLSRIEKGVRTGSRVRQKQVVARVGNTGRSTGPHLHYGMKLRGRHVNPLGQRFPPAKPVPKSELTRFKRAIAPLAKQLGAIENPDGDQTAANQKTSTRANEGEKDTG